MDGKLKFYDFESGSGLGEKYFNEILSQEIKLFKTCIEFVQYYFCFMFGFLGHMECGILGPSPGIKLTLPVLESEILTTGWTTREVPGGWAFKIWLHILKLVLNK